MAMSANDMANKIVTNLTAINPAIASQPGINANWAAICQGIIDTVKQEMVVTVQLTAVPVTGGAGGAVTGTAANVAGSGVS